MQLPGMGEEAGGKGVIIPQALNASGGRARMGKRDYTLQAALL